MFLGFSNAITKATTSHAHAGTVVLSFIIDCRQNGIVIDIYSYQFIYNKLQTANTV